MGKKIIVKGADFSVNGFTFREIKKEYTQLKMRGGADAVYPVSLSQSWYTCAISSLENYSVLSLDHTNSENAVSLGVNVEDYTHVKVEGFGQPLTGWPLLSCPIIACVDNDNNVLGGIIPSLDAEGDAKLLGAGWSEVVRPNACQYPSTFEMDIPAGTTKIYTSMALTEEHDEFKMTLSKYEL